MSSNEYAAPLTLNLRPSGLAAGIVSFVHLGALCSILFIPLFALFKIILSILVLASLWGVYRWVLLKTSASIKQIVWGTDNNWILIQKNGEKRAAKLLPSTYVHAWMTILNFNAECFRSCSVVLLPGAIDPHEWRRLRVRLRLAQYSLWE